MHAAAWGSVPHAGAIGVRVLWVNQIHRHLGVVYGWLEGFRVADAGERVALSCKGPHGGW